MSKSEHNFYTQCYMSKHSETIPPPILSVSREARKEALTHYVPSFDIVEGQDTWVPKKLKRQERAKILYVIELEAVTHNTFIQAIY